MASLFILHTRTYFQGRDFYSYNGVFMPLPLLGLELHIGICSPELVSTECNRSCWIRVLEFYSPMQYLSADESTANFKGHVVFKMYNPQAMLGGSLVTTAWRVLRLRMEGTPSRYGG
jgi:hypothetical protein